ncbi:MAG TPA: YdcF family protein [Acidisarcina sp.]|nr:YdcF family protein [Acidisarcina sp.]
MIVPDTNLRGARKPGRSLLRWLLPTAVFVALGWFAWVYSQIQYFAEHDEARTADAIAVFGAAEYDGRPSPVLRARLDHALSLYEQGIAPLVITLGGAGDEVHSEGGVGHDYLLAHGVPESQIIAETQSVNTGQQARRLAVIARANHLRRIVIVSDGTHLFRIHELCAAEGLEVYTSPRPPGKSISGYDSAERMLHEMMSYAAWRLHIHWLTGATI